LDYKLFLVQHLTLVDKVVRFVARRHHLTATDTEDFASVVRLKLVERDFAILRKFQQRSAFSTYLTVVVERLCLDFCIAKWGKWRPSAAARRLGSIAILLEQLIVREGITFDEAVGTLQTNHGVSATREELHGLLLQLPVRAARHGSTPLTDNVGGQSIEKAFEDREDEDLVARVNLALRHALLALTREDQEILRLRFGQGLSVSECARVLSLPPKQLYRRVGHIIHVLRAELEQRGVDEPDIARIVGHPTLAVHGVLDNHGRNGRN
jgi:RNA polymerase sigma factor (sigma-70 family)